MTNKHKEPTVKDIVKQFNKNESIEKKKKKIANQWLIDGIKRLKDQNGNNNN